MPKADTPKFRARYGPIVNKSHKIQIIWIWNRENFELFTSRMAPYSDVARCLFDVTATDVTPPMTLQCIFTSPVYNTPNANSSIIVSCYYEAGVLAVHHCHWLYAASKVVVVLSQISFSISTNWIPYEQFSILRPRNNSIVIYRQ